MNKPRLHPWSRLLVSTALCWHLHLAVVPGHAQPRFEGEGRVVVVDESQSTVTLDHGPILGLMPAMRMAFPVQRLSSFWDFRSVHWCDFPSRLVVRNG